MRYLGEAPLIEDDSVRSEPTSLVNVETGLHLTTSLDVSVSVFNLFDDDGNDITYFYESRLPDEAQPVSDLHFHPVEPQNPAGDGYLAILTGPNRQEPHFGADLLRCAARLRDGARRPVQPRTTRGETA